MKSFPTMFLCCPVTLIDQDAGHTAAQIRNRIEHIAISENHKRLMDFIADTVKESRHDTEED